MKEPAVMDPKVLDGVAKLWAKNEYVKGMSFENIRRHVEWKYNPERACLFVEDLNGIVIGTCGFLKTIVWTSRGLLECRWGMDSLVDASARTSNNFLFLKVMRMPLRFQAPEKQVLLCFPNEVVRSTYLKIGMKPVGDFSRYQCQLSGVEQPSLAGLLNDPGQKADMKLSWETDFGDRDIGQLSDRLREQFPLSLKKDSAYLLWRYSAAPLRRHVLLVARRNKHVVGFLVVRFSIKEGKQICDIVDILCGTEDRLVFERMLDEVKRFCREKGISNISTAVSHKVFSAVLLSSGFTREKSEEVLCWAKNEAIHELFQQNKDQIHITMGDGDYDME